MMSGINRRLRLPSGILFLLSLSAAGCINVVLRAEPLWGHAHPSELIMFYGTTPLTIGLLVAGAMRLVSRIGRPGPVATPWRGAALISIALHIVIWANPNTYAQTLRSSQVRAEFQRHNPCPTTGERRGPCPGWQVDHIQALKCGGQDAPDNMQWLTVEAHREKTRRDMRGCRRRVE